MGRTPLTPDTILEITDETEDQKNRYKVTINSVCGYGTSSIVYYGKLNGNNVLVKEIYPADLDITRGGDDGRSLIVPEEQKDRFDYYTNTAKNAYKTQKELHNEPITNNSTSFSFLKGKCNGTSYYISEYKNGKTLEEWIGTYRNDDFVENLLLICKRISDVLQKYHEKEYIHLDVKPSNILVLEINGVLMFDFDSVYKLKDPKNKLEDLKNDYVRYSPGYVAPEVEYFPQDIDPDRTDIYSVGAILFKGIFGKDPPSGGINRRYDFDWSDKDLCPDLKRQLEEIFRKTLSISVCGRYEKAEELSKALFNAIKSTKPNDLDVNFLNRIKGSRSETDKKINDGSDYPDTRTSIMKSFDSAFGLLEIDPNKNHVKSKELINSIIGILRFIPFVSYDENTIENIMSLCNWLSEIEDLSDNKQFMINTHQLYCMKFSNNKANDKKLILKWEITEEDLASEDPFEVEIYCRFLGLLCEYYYESMISKDDNDNKKVFLIAHKTLSKISDNTINKFEGYNRLLIATDLLQIGCYSALSFPADLPEEEKKLLDKCEDLLDSLRLKDQEEKALSNNEYSEEWLIPLICYSLLKGTIMSIRQVQFDESNNADQYIFSGYYLLCRFYDIVSGREKFNDEDYLYNYKMSGMEEIISNICHLLLKTICKKQEDENTEPIVLAESFFWEREDYNSAYYIAEWMDFYGIETDIEKYDSIDFNESRNTLYDLFCSDDSQT